MWCQKKYKFPNKICQIWPESWIVCDCWSYMKCVQIAGHIWNVYKMYKMLVIWNVYKLLVIWNVYKFLVSYEMCTKCGRILEGAVEVRDVTSALVNGSCWNILRCGGGGRVVEVGGAGKFEEGLSLLFVALQMEHIFNGLCSPHHFVQQTSEKAS